MKPRATKTALKLAFAILLVLIPSGTPLSAAGNSYYVAISGNDSNPGTKISPFRTIKKGAAVLQPGDRLYVKTGTYVEALNHIPGGTSWDTPVTVAAAPGHSVTIKAPVGSPQVFSFVGPTQGYIIIDGFVIDGSDARDDVVRISRDHIRIQNAEIINLSQSGIGIRVIPGDTSGTMGCCNEFINLNLHDERTDPEIIETVALLIESTGNLVERSQIHSNWGDGLVLMGDDLNGADNNIVRNNRIFNNGRAGTGAALTIAQGSGNLAYNNIVLDNAAGISLGRRAFGAKVYNNTVYSNIRFGLFIDSSTASDSPTAVINNILYRNGKDLEDPGPTAGLANNLEIDPSFVDPANDDFRLQATSAAIDAGVALAEVQDDNAGIPRPQGATHDIGAFEFVGPAVSSAGMRKLPANNSASTGTPLTQSAAAAFDFFLTNGGDRSIVQGQTVTNDITAMLNSELTQAVSFLVSGLPKGATASFSSGSCEPTCSTLLTITTSPATKKGKYLITVTGSAAGANSTTQFTLAVFKATDGVLTLTWVDNSTNEAGFYIERKTETAGKFARLRKAKQNNTSYIDSKLTVGTTYCYHVQAYNKAGVSAFTNEACGTAILP